MTEERKIRGLHYEEKGIFGPALSVAADADHSWDDTGFRLVHDSAKQNIIGGSIVYNFNVARQSDAADVSPRAQASSIGFRLVREGT